MEQATEVTTEALTEAPPETAEIIDRILQQKAQKRAAANTPAAKPRFAGIDIVKIVACFFVVGVHFFRNSDFYSMPITKDFGTLAIYIRFLTFICVPLFMTTTGFLMKNKTLSGKYYLGIIRVLVIYIIISLICVRFNQAYFHLHYSTHDIIRGLFMYSDAQYSWYVEYYFTIFLLIPFLNAGWQAMETRGKKTVMLLTVILLTMISPSFYIGTVRAEQIRIIPGYFSLCYPIGYYYIGTYIREFPPKRDLRHKLFFVITGLFALIYVSTMTLYQSLKNTEKNCVFFSWHNNDYGAWPVILLSTSVFLLLFDIRIKNERTAKILARLSNATFAAYLISYVYDALFYQKLIHSVEVIRDRFRYAPLIVPAVFILSMLSGLLLETVYELAARRVRKDIAAIRQRRARVISGPKSRQ